MRRSLWLVTPTIVPAIALAVAGLAPQAGATNVAASHVARPAAGARPALQGVGANTPFCQGLGTRYQASSGAQMYCFGAQRPTGQPSKRAAVVQGPGAPANTDAATVSEDVSPAGVPGQGQSETSIAAAGPYVVEAWNDATGFITNCPAAMSKEELTGLGFSANGGKSFTDLGGLPNPACSTKRYEGDPTVAAYRVAGQTYFYISSLYPSFTGSGTNAIAFDACKVIGSGAGATLSCAPPTIAATSSQCEVFGTHKFCSFLDKSFLSLDPAHGRLYVTYSDFLVHSTGGPDAIDMSVCDLGNPAGGPGPAGGTPGDPVCEHGTKLVKVSTHLLQAKPYLTVAPADPKGCEVEGAYPAADPATGAAYVGYEYNWFTSFIGFPPCQDASAAVRNVLAKEAAHCLVLARVSPCPGPTAAFGVPVVSLQATFVPGYNRFPGSDFPRLAVSDRFRTVSMVWNDTRFHPLGDILLQSFRRSLQPVQSSPVMLDRPHHGGLSFLPAVRSASSSGRLDVSWFSRATPGTSVTNVEAALGVSPMATTTPSNARITNVASNWDNTSSFIVPNFGDYTDNAVAVTGSWPFVGTTLYVAWSDGRIGIPQPFAAHVPAG